MNYSSQKHENQLTWDTITISHFTLSVLNKAKGAKLANT